MQALKWRWTKATILVSMLCLFSTVSCHKAPAPSTLEVSASANCNQDCVAVTKQFVLEHALLFDQNIKLKAALKACQGQP